jgi:hypothetical protein
VIVGGLRFNRKQRFVECAGTLGGIKRWSTFLTSSRLMASCAVVARREAYMVFEL